MSTSERYRSIVGGALFDVSRNHHTGAHLWATVGEVANQAGVSRPTARKYLDILVSQEWAEKIDKGYTVLYMFVEKQES
jgi:DNA-binding IclR family transcriptional regulator